MDGGVSSIETTIHEPRREPLSPKEFGARIGVSQLSARGWVGKPIETALDAVPHNQGFPLRPDVKPTDA
jgi:hypothetical protein